MVTSNRCIYIVAVTYDDEDTPADKDTGHLICERLSLTLSRARRQVNDGPVAANVMAGEVVVGVCYTVCTEVQLQGALRNVGAKLALLGASTSAVVVISAHGCREGVSALRSWEMVTRWMDVAIFLRLSEYIGKCLALTLDCCTSLGELATERVRASRQLASRMGVRKLLSDVFVSGYGTGSGDEGWDASFACCMAGVECAWGAFGGITYDVKELPALVEQCGQCHSAQSDYIGQYRCLPLKVNK